MEADTIGELKEKIGTEKLDIDVDDYQNEIRVCIERLFSRLAVMGSLLRRPAK